MSRRAEKAAIKAYPNLEQPVWDKSYPKTLFVRHTERNAFIKGYEQAEKDLELTWQDIKDIHIAIESVLTHTAWDDIYYPTDDSLYTEVLKLYNEQKNQTHNDTEHT